MNLVESSSLSPLPARPLAVARPGTLGADLKALLKPRITLMVLLTVAIGYVCGSPSGIAWVGFFHALFGITAVAAGASVLNQWLEQQTDGLMNRTKNRPLPAGRMEPATVLAFGSLLGVGGVLYLLATTNPLTAALAMATFVGYVVIYTPLKRYTPWNTVVGAVPGALPPVLGYAAAAGTVDPIAWSLFGILFLWQFPHFWAIAWMYREDYARAGLVMLPAVDCEEGKLTGRMMAKAALLLLVVSLVPSALGLTGLVYFVAALGLGGMYLGSSVAFWRTPSLAKARQTLLVSLLYLPVLLLILMLDGPWGLTR